MAHQKATESTGVCIGGNMVIERYRKNGEILNRPFYKKDLILFLHCADGCESVTTRVLNAKIWPLMSAHGETHLRIRDNSRK